MLPYPCTHQPWIVFLLQMQRIKTFCDSKLQIKHILQQKSRKVQTEEIKLARLPGNYCTIKHDDEIPAITKEGKALETY